MTPLVKFERAATQSPKYEWVKTWLRDQISSGRFPVGHRLPPQDKLSQILKIKVAEITVRRALSDLAQEGLIVRRRRLGSFVANQHIRPLIPGRNLRIGVLWPSHLSPQDIHGSFNGQITLGILAGLGFQEQGIPSWFMPNSNEATGCTWNEPQRAIRLSCIGQTVQSRERHPSMQALLGGAFDGIVCVNIIENDWLAQLLTSGVPIVLADYPLDDFRHRADQVFVEPLPAMRAAVAHFLKNGAKSIHYVGARLSGAALSPDSSFSEWREKYFGQKRDDPDSLLREFSVRRALSEYGISPAPEQFHHISYDHGELEKLAGKLLAMSVETRPDTVICHDIQTTKALISAFGAKGIALQGSGVTGDKQEGPGKALRIFADGFQVGLAAAELLVSRLLRPTRPHLSVGVSMEFQPPTDWMTKP